MLLFSEPTRRQQGEERLELITGDFSWAVWRNVYERPPTPNYGAHIHNNVALQRSEQMRAAPLCVCLCVSVLTGCDISGFV